MTITEFLEARIAEDEAAVTRRGPYPHSWHGTDAAGSYKPGCPDCMGVASKARVLAECTAKRKLLSILEHGTEVWDGERWVSPLKVMAAVYADHSEYRQEWA
jgi:hypothetical protein